MSAPSFGQRWIVVGDTFSSIAVWRIQRRCTSLQRRSEFGSMAAAD